MERLLNWLSIFIHKAIWTMCFIFIIYLIFPPLDAITNSFQTWPDANFQNLFCLVLILTSTICVYIIANVLDKSFSIKKAYTIVRGDYQSAEDADEEISETDKKEQPGNY
ncbi:hypothetical protein ACVUCS_003627 [Salmonella enterica subsp. enterica]